ncbi:M15 family metallopeptidase [Modestobacter altitudinis]|uniref:M15 family metallopeptidase n=1 Tax=Modestobacter altitudinis TaxID=2213158 RepID=UPI00110D1DBF|nr:M15 family metallopeptidase [Modestobacter altitudinis]
MASSSQGAGHRAARRRGSGARRVVVALVLLAVVAAVVGLVREARSSGPPPTVAAAVPSSNSVAPSSSAPPTTSTPAPPTTPPAEPTFDRAQQSIDDPNSPWVVVDKARPLAPLDHAPADLVDIGGRQLRAEAAQAMRDMIAAAAAQGLTISVLSAYRSYDYQVDTFRNQVARFGEERAEIQVARPGYSEHQTGLAADVGGGGCDIESCFATTAEGQWVAAHGAEFGYVVRYPDGAQDVTGYKYEPWHVRYVGVPLATELQRTGTRTLEEFFGLPAAPGYPG